MNLKAERTKILDLVQRNRLGIIKNEQELDGLKNGSMFLQGQLTLIDRLIQAEQLIAEEKAKNENISADLQPPAVPPTSATPLRSESDSGSTTRNNS